MNSNLTFCSTVLDRLRALIDEPDTDGKYTNDFLLRHCVMPAMVDVLSRLNQNSDAPIVIRYAITVVAGQRYYQLPPQIQEIWRLVALDSAGNLAGDFYPRGQFHPQGPGWSIEGNILTLDPSVLPATDLYVLYVPSGDFLPHYGTSPAVISLAADGVTQRMKLTTAPLMGQVDTRENAYAGAILRVISSTGGASVNVMEERIISRSYISGTDWWAEVRVPFVRHTTAQIPLYEIAPPASQPLYQGIATEAALILGAMRSISDSKAAKLQLMHRAAMKTIKDNLANLQLRTGKSFLKNTVDNPQFVMLF